VADDDSTERIEVARAIAADPATIFDVLRDPQGHVAIDASGMLMSASGAAGHEHPAVVQERRGVALAAIAERRDRSPGVGRGVVELGAAQGGVLFVTAARDQDLDVRQRLRRRGGR
jgi:hypothetical protein